MRVQRVSLGNTDFIELRINIIYSQTIEIVAVIYREAYKSEYIR